MGDNHSSNSLELIPNSNLNSDYHLSTVTPKETRYDTKCVIRISSHYFSSSSSSLSELEAMLEL